MAAPAGNLKEISRKIGARLQAFHLNVMLPIRRHQPKEVSGEVVSSRKEAATSRSLK
jgi:hypothetical protein